MILVKILSVLIKILVIIIAIPIYVILIPLFFLNLIFIIALKKECQFITKLGSFLYGSLVILGILAFYLTEDIYIARNEGIFKRKYFKEQLIEDWSNINYVKKEFNAPFFCHFVYLHNGKKLRIDNSKELLNIAKDKNIELR